MKPICVPCQRFYRPKTNGFYFTEGMPVPSDTPPGKDHATGWRPYKLWAGDLWECQGCGHQIIVGVPPLRHAEHYEPDFESERKRLGGDRFQVNDC